MKRLFRARARIAIVGLAALGTALLLSGSGCGPEQRRPAGQVVPEGEHDPAVWGALYPEQYARWQATAQPRPAGKSLYKRGFDGGVMYDKLSEFPFMPLLFNGWGFGVEYNEPRGHHYMMIDQQIIDPARVKAGGGCLTCKSPYAEDLREADHARLFSATYLEAVEMIPEHHRQLGATCIDCHDNRTMQLRVRRWTAESALEEIGLPFEQMNLAQRRLIACGQCHCTYSVMKADGASVDVDFPWEGSTWGSITVENIIDRLENDPARLEWTQSVTGFRLGFIRHPDVEFYTASSVHAAMGVACADCHMPRMRVNDRVIRDHNLMSPLKQDMKACDRCHPDGAETRRAKVLAIQERTLAQMIDAGYRVATVAKLIERANETLDFDSSAVKPTFDEAAAHFRQAFYRLNYMGAENSVGFHNPAEAARILADAAAEADAAEAMLRELLASNGVAVPAELPLELRSYLDGRGEHGLRFKREHYIPDPTGNAQARWPQNHEALLK